ncbi:MAG: DNA polymerase III subunit beta [Flavobacteriales bacterium]|nr:DNA polymerase III subunit beta [Flavobacteriales bacterium]
MKFIVTSSELLKHLQSVSGVLASNNTLPILDNFLFEIEKDALTISASDLETTMITRLPVKSEETGAIAVPARIVLDYLKTLPEQPLTFTVDETSLGIEISSSYGKSKVAGYSADEFPRNPEMEEASSVSVPAEVLSEAIHKTIFATGNDDLRPVMSGIYCEFSNEGLRFVATDAHKLVRYTRSDSKADKNSTFIIPKKPLNLLKGALSSTSAQVSLEFNTSNVKISFDDTVLIARLIDGKYPNYEAVIPKDNPNKMLVERTALLGSIRRVSIFSNKTTHQVRLRISGSELSVSAEDLDFANEANERLTCSYEGEDMEIGFNSRFLIDMLNNLNTPDVQLQLSAPNRAGILVPMESENEGEDILMLVMPVMLNT